MKFGSGPAGLAVGTLAGRATFNASPLGFVYYATDDNGGTAYVTDGAGNWKPLGPRGVLAKTRVNVAVSATTMAGSAALDIPGLVLPAFTYLGRPVKATVRIPFSKFSATGVVLSASIYDATNAKELARDPFVTPAVANTTFTLHAETEPISAFPDGTGFVVGQSYIWKGRVFTGASGGDYSAALAANSVFAAHIEVVER